MHHEFSEFVEKGCFFLIRCGSLRLLRGCYALENNFATSFTDTPRLHAAVTASLGPHTFGCRCSMDYSTSSRSGSIRASRACIVHLVYQSTLSNTSVSLTLLVINSHLIAVQLARFQQMFSLVDYRLKLAAQQAKIRRTSSRRRFDRGSIDWPILYIRLVRCLRAYAGVSVGQDGAEWHSKLAQPKDSA
jgi:hypothetical protein